MTLLLKLWPYLIGVALIIGAGWYAHHAGYESGYAAREAFWRPKFDAAARELAAANARTEKTEADSKLAAEASQRRIDETQQALHVRAADYDGRLRSLSVRLAAASANRCKVPEAAGSPAGPDGTTEVEQRASAAGGRIAGTGTDCESDAATIAEWQRFYTEQRAIINEPPPREQ